MRPIHRDRRITGAVSHARQKGGGEALGFQHLQRSLLRIRIRNPCRHRVDQQSVGGKPAHAIGLRREEIEFVAVERRLTVAANQNGFARERAIALIAARDKGLPQSGINRRARLDLEQDQRRMAIKKSRTPVRIRSSSPSASISTKSGGDQDRMVSS